MKATTQFSMRMEPELIREIDEAAEKEYKTRTDLIKEAVIKLLQEKTEQDKLKKLAAELWLRGELPDIKLKKVLSEIEIENLKFGKQWVEELIHEIRK